MGAYYCAICEFFVSFLISLPVPALLGAGMVNMSLTSNDEVIFANPYY